jgi:hypothetical protein
MDPVVAVDQLAVAQSASTVIAREFVRTGSIDNDIGNTHEIPKIDQDLGVPNKKREHFFVAVDLLDGHTTENRR